MIKHLLKYGVVTIFSQIILFVGVILLIGLLGMQKNIAYFIIVSLVYIIVYFIFVKYVFDSSIGRKTIVKYSIAVLFFWIFNNIFFAVMVNFLNLNYLLVVVINICLFGLIRFFVYKNLVFKDGK